MGRLEAIGISANLSLVSMVFGFDLVKFSSSMTAMRDLLSSLMSICRLPGLLWSARLSHGNVRA